MASQWGDMTLSYRQAIHAAIIKNFGSSQTKAEAARPLEELTAIPAGIRYAHNMFSPRTHTSLTRTPIPIFTHSSSSQFCTILEDGSRPSF